jgi:type II secretory pathway component PulM
MKVILLAMCFILSLFSTLAHSALMVLQPERRSYQVGDTIQLELKITDLSTTVGAFWTQLQYQPTALQLQSWQFGTGLDDGAGSLQFAEHDALNGVITLDEYTFPTADPAALAAAQLSSLQQGGLVLARFTFQALQAGDWQLGLNPQWFGVESFAGDRIKTDAADLNLTVTAAQVPAPATLLMLLGGIVLLSQRRRTANFAV